MAEAQVPYSWVGRQVEASILQGTSNILGPTGLAAYERVGTLEVVNNLGIVASLRYGRSLEIIDEGEPVSMFYPWSSVVWLRLAESTL